MENEDAIKKKVIEVLSDDFELRTEVSGTHLIEGAGVRIDFMAKPKEDYLHKGFVDEWFGIECKHISTIGPCAKVNRLFWQAITYNQSEYTIEDQTVRPRFVLIASNLTMGTPEYGNWNYAKASRHHAQLTSNCGLAYYAGVGVLSVRDSADFTEWHMVFGTGETYAFRRKGTWIEVRPHNLPSSRVGSL